MSKASSTKRSIDESQCDEKVGFGKFSFQSIHHLQANEEDQKIHCHVGDPYISSFSNAHSIVSYNVIRLPSYQICSPFSKIKASVRLDIAWPVFLVTAIVSFGFCS